MNSEKISRRSLLQGSALSLASLAIARRARAEEARAKTLVCLFQRGAVDSLSMVVPHAEAAYYAARPKISIARPGAKDGCLDLDGRFGLHPKLAALAPLFAKKELAIIHATGSPDPTRSHFDAQAMMEAGSPSIGTVRDGWIDRALRGTARTTFREVAFGNRSPAALAGGGALVIEDLASFGIQVKRPRVRAKLEDAFDLLYRGDDPVAAAGHDAFEAMDALADLDPENYSPANGATYPKGQLGKKFSQVAQLIKAGLGTRAIFLDAGGWDTHTGQIGRLNPLLAELGDSIAAFHADLGDRMRDVLLLTMSEFGRTVAENGTGGTDHGHGGAMFVLGGGAKGGRVLGRWPGLEHDARYEGRDLAVTTDFREVIAEVAAHHLGAKDLPALLPGFKAGTPPGIFG